MEGSGQSFKVIDLKRLDPAQALVTINKFFRRQLPKGATARSSTAIRRPESCGFAAPAIRLNLVEKLLTELEGEDSLRCLGDKVRLLPYTGRAAEDALQQVEGLWPVLGRENPIRTITPAAAAAVAGIPERR